MASASRSLSLHQISGSNFAYQHFPLEVCFRDLAELGFDDVELWGIAPQLHVPWLTDTEARATRRLAADHGLSVICFTPEQVAYPINIASPDAQLREASIAMFLRAAELAVELGSPRLFLTSGRGFESEPVTVAWERSAEALSQITSRAADLGLECLLEPLQRVESNLVTNARSAERMLTDVGAVNLSVTLDTVAMAVAGENVDAWFSIFGDRIGHVHLIDGTPAGHRAWSDGDLPLNEILAALKRHQYGGHLTVELFGDGSYALDPKSALQRSLEQIAGSCVFN